MNIIDISFDVMLRMMTGTKTAKFFYINRKKAIEIYTIMNGVFFRHIHIKLGNEQDSIFAETYLKDSIPIISISHVNEDEWKGVANIITNKLNKIEAIIDAMWEDKKA